MWATELKIVLASTWLTINKITEINGCEPQKFLLTFLENRTKL